MHALARQFIVALGCVAFLWGCTPVESTSAAKQNAAAEAALVKHLEHSESAAENSAGDSDTASVQVAANTPSSGGLPVFEADAFEYDFGEADSTESIKHDFVIRNTGTGVLELGKPTTSCGCTVANVGDSTLEPGEETRISATLSLAGRQGEVAKSITVTSNDPERNPALFMLKGIAIAPIMMEPKLLSFGTIEDDEPHYASMTLRAMKDDIAFDIVDIQHNMTGFNVKVEPVVPRKEFKITLYNPEPLAPKSYYGRFTIRTDDPAHTNLSFTASAVVVGELRIQPDKVTLLASNVPDKKTDLAFRVDPGRTKEFKLLEVVPPIEGTKVEVVELGGRNSYLVKLMGLPQDMSLNGKVAVLKTNLPDKPEIEVPFEVRELTVINQPTPTTPLVVRPSQITLIANSTQPDARSTAIFYVSAGTTREFKITEVVPPAEGVSVEFSAQRDNYYLVKLTGLPQDIALNGTSVLVKTDGPQVAVPILVRPNASAVRTVQPTASTATSPTTVRPATQP